MNFKDILVHVDDRPTCASRLEVATHLARHQGAQLTGIYIITQPRQSSAKAEKAFRKAASDAGLSCEWICFDSIGSRLDVVNAINLHAHYHDLLVLSQTDEDDPDRSIPATLPEKAVLGSGRPVLIVPYAGSFPRDFKRILLTWRGGSESSRALHDAMPILRKAEQINVISVQGREGDELYQLHSKDIAKHLALYQLAPVCEKRVTGRELSVGDLLLNRCAEAGVDLLVMGATSQLRRGTQTLGETGRYMLHSMTVPVLMSH
ncbi:MAG: hypothetical protein C0622_14240 [Desulfuromonas sp.]|nr:MAG: hypothetical protein C0622_14240 [Desulfuromonas sp.]